MYARVTRIQGSPGQVEAGLQSVRDMVIPALSRMEGFAGVFVLVDHESGAGLHVTLWESEEALRASEAQTEGVRRDSAASAGVQVVDVGRYDVGLWEVTAASA